MRQVAWAGASFHREDVRPMNSFCRMSDSAKTNPSLKQYLGLIEADRIVRKTNRGLQ